VPWRVSDEDNVISSRDAKFCVSTNAKQGWLIRSKKLYASELTIDCHRSGQFASALWLIAEEIGLKKLHVLPENPSSLSYIEMTKAVVNGSVKLEDGYLADWSAAVYWYARLLLEGQMQSSTRPYSSSGTAFGDAPVSYKLLQLDLSSIQSDAVIARWFTDWGIESRQEEDGVVITYKENLIKPQEVIELDMCQNLDLVPVLACMACLWPKKMIFNGVANLRYKESNRLQIIQEQLSAFANIKVNTYGGVDDNQLVIDPCGDVLQRISTTNNGVNSGRDAKICVSTNDIKSSVDFVFDAHNDHRFVMGFSLFALCGKVRVNGFDSVKKSYPNFKAEGVVAGTDMVG
jgi:5-enolpyruvylshikimate-3-phosphate synthase